jgi:glycerol kinase
MAKYVMGIDQGTTLTKAVIFDHDARIVSSSAVENRLYFPRKGWVEQDPQEILEATLKAAGEAFKNSRITPDDIDAIGISNQLMTTIFWDKKSGEPVGRAISWQDNRNLSLGEKLIESTMKEEIEERTGVHIFPNNASTKIRWLMDHDKSIQRGIVREELLFGTVDTWLIWKLSGGQAHVTDLSNICISLLFNTHTLNYDNMLVNKFGIPYEILPQLRSSSEIYAYTQPEMFFGARLPIAGDAGDQFAAIFGQACYSPGLMMCNLGTGSSLILNTGDRIFPPGSGVDSPVLWSVDGKTSHGIGSWSNASGAAIQWLRDELGIIHDLAEAEVLAARVSDTQGVYFVPAFSGLGSPYQDPYARGSFFGITQGTTKNHLVRSALEAIAYQIRDSFEAVKNKAEFNIDDSDGLWVGGGSSRNDFLMQFLADILGAPINRPTVYESSVLGAAFLAGLATGYWDSMEETKSLVRIDRRFNPYYSEEQRDELYSGWQKAIKHSLGWLKS